MEDRKKSSSQISKKSFITAILVIFGIMVIAYLLTFLIPGGEYVRNAEGKIDPDSFHSVEGGIPFWKWILSPFLVLGAEGNTTILAVIAFLIIIGGVFEALNRSGLLEYMLNRILLLFKKSRYQLMATLIFFFMALGSLIGSFEETVPLVPIVVALAVRLGWDTLTGLSMSILAVGCGFASGVLNPFTVGVAQQLAGIPMFSGVWLRMLSFIVIYGLLFLFTYYHAKKVEKPLESITISEDFTPTRKMDAALLSFGIILGVGILAIVSSTFLPFLRDYTMIIVAVVFLIAGIVSPRLSGLPGKKHLSSFAFGSFGLLPAVLMILMASSVKYTIEEANVLDTILHGAVGAAENMPKALVVLFIYLIVLVMNFFIASGSAKAFMLIPLIIPMAEVFGISYQLCILAFAFGDGFSNVYYPTNPVLLISLGLVDEDYGTWCKRTTPFQLANLALTCGILLFGFAVGY